MDPVEVHQSSVATAPPPAPPAPPAETRPVDATLTGIGVPQRGYTETRINATPYRRVVQLTWLICGVFDAVLALDFLFRALSAHDTGFASLIYTVGAVLGAPFDGIFGNTVNMSANHLIGIDRWGDLVAIAIYTLIAAGIAQLARITMTPKDSVSSTSTTVV